MVLKALTADDWTVVDWDRAACLGVDPDLFFPDRGQDTAQAKRVCLGCSIVADCGEYALRVGESHGVWGGMSERQRRRIRSDRNR